MIATLREFWASRTPAARIAVTVTSVLVVTALLAWTTYSIDKARTRLHAAVTTLPAQARQVDTQADEIERLRGNPAAQASQTDLRTHIQNQVNAAGLTRALGRVDATDADQVQVVFGSIAYAEWLAWIERLQMQQIHLDTCRIEALATRGMVNVTATLVRARSK